MANTVIQLKKSSTPTAIPADLANGELAINFADGKLYYKGIDGIVKPLGETSNFGIINANGTIILSDSSGDTFTLQPDEFITITGDAINDRITIGANLKSVFDTANNAVVRSGDTMSGPLYVTDSNTAIGRFWAANTIDVFAKNNHAAQLNYDNTNFVYVNHNTAGIQLNGNVSILLDGSSNDVFVIANVFDVFGNVFATYYYGDGTYLDGVIHDLSPVFDKANTVESNLANTAIAANNYAGAMANAANTYAASLTPDLTPAFNQANDAYVVANAAFDKANAANVLAYNTGIGANAYAISVGDSSNAYARVFANTVGLSANNYAGAMANAANAYAASLTPDLTPAFDKANLAYTVANAAFDVANAAYGNANSVAISANNYAGAMANSVNATVATIVSANLDIARAYTNTSVASANNYAGSMANSANDYATATYATQTTVATNATSANNYAGAMANAANGFASTIVDANLVTARAYTNTSTTAANNYAGSMANAVNVYVTNVYTTTNAAFDKANAANVLAYNIGIGANAYTSSVHDKTNSAFGVANSALQNTTVTLNGELTTTGKIYANSEILISPVDGFDEGGQITLYGASTYTDWFIDSYKNELRFFNGNSGVQQVNFFNAVGGTLSMGVNRGNPGFTLDVAGVVNASAIYVNGSPIGAGSMDYAYVNTSSQSSNNYAGAMANAANAYAASLTPDLTPAFNQANAAYVVANAGFDKANTVASDLSNTAISANNYAGFMANSVNSYIDVVGPAGNNYAGIMANSSNGYARSYANTIGINANNWSNAYANAVGVNANNYAGFMANSANGFAQTIVGDVSNVVNTIGVVTNSSYVVANAAFDKANAANVLAFNTGIAVNAYVNVSTTAANNFMGATANSINGYVMAVDTKAQSAFNLANNLQGQIEVLSGNANVTIETNQAAFNVANAAFNKANTAANNLSNTAIAANNYAGAMANSSNNYAGVLANNVNAKVQVKNTAPTTPAQGTLWWDNEYGRLLIYYTDADTSQWVDASPSTDPTPIYNIANSAFSSANSVGITVNSAFSTANTVGDVANAAFDKANNVISSSLAFAVALGI